MSDTKYTTITVREQTKDQLDEHRDGRKWDQYLQMLCREYSDPLTLNDAEELAEFLVDELGAQAGGPDVDDTRIAADVVQQFDYAKLSERVADELEGRTR